MRVTKRQKIAAYLVHVYTALGLVFVFLSTAELVGASPEPRMVFLWLILAVLVDATDGPLARANHVKVRAPLISGRTIDDIIDYMTFTFIPLMLVWRMDWLPEPASLWVIIAMITSIFGFANTEAKQEARGFFRGFPSYWNIYAIYAGLWYYHHGPLPGLAILLLLAGLTVMPVNFIYPNLAPRGWKPSLLIGAFAWLALIACMLPFYPHIPEWLLWVSYIYPAYYIILSVYLDLRIPHKG